MMLLTIAVAYVLASEQTNAELAIRTCIAGTKCAGIERTGRTHI